MACKLRSVAELELLDNGNGMHMVKYRAKLWVFSLFAPSVAHKLGKTYLSTWAKNQSFFRSLTPIVNT